VGLFLVWELVPTPFCTSTVTTKFRFFISISTCNAVVPKLVPAVPQIKVAIMSYYPQYFTVIAHNTEQHCGFGSPCAPEESHITPGG